MSRTATMSQKPPGVNLLPDDLRAAALTRLRRRWWLGAVLAAWAFTGLALIWSRYESREIIRIRATLLDEIAAIRNEQQRRAALAARAELLEKRLGVLDEIVADESWSHRLAEIARAVPPDAMLRRLQVVETAPAAKAADDAKQRKNPPVSAPEVHLEGVAADHQALALFLHELKQAGSFADVRLVRAAALNDADTFGLDFAIACRR